MRNFLSVIGSWVLSAGLLLGAAHAQQPQAIGFVKTVTGDASVTTSGKPVKAVAGTPVYVGSVLKTGVKNSTMGVTFKDNQMMSFGPDTELTVDDFLYAPAKGDLKFASSLTKGTLNVISGGIAKLKPDAVTTKTPTGTIGVRGTNYVVKVEPD